MAPACQSFDLISIKAIMNQKTLFGISNGTQSETRSKATKFALTLKWYLTCTILLVVISVGGVGGISTFTVYACFCCP